MPIILTNHFIVYSNKEYLLLLKKYFRTIRDKEKNNFCVFSRYEWAGKWIKLKITLKFLDIRALEMYYIAEALLLFNVLIQINKTAMKYKFISKSFSPCEHWLSVRGEDFLSALSLFWEWRDHLSQREQRLVDTHSLLGKIKKIHITNVPDLRFQDALHYLVK